MTAECPLPDVPQNAVLLGFLRGQASLPKLGRTDDYGGYELHTHPDLISRLTELARRRAVLPVYGVAVVAYEGVAACVALGTSHLLFRLPAVPSDLRGESPIPPLTDDGWHALNAWQSELPSAEGLRKLSGLVRAALGYAGDPAAQ